MLSPSIPICSGSVFTQSLWGSNKQGDIIFINKTMHDKLMHVKAENNVTSEVAKLISTK